MPVGYMGVRVGLGLTLASLLALPLGACSGSLGEALGMGKRAPDEFAVVRRQPLIIPPDFDLRPPRPGVERPVGERPSDRAYASLTREPAGNGTGQATAAAPTRPRASATMSPGQRALLAEVDSVRPDPDIRESLSAGDGTAGIDRGLLTRLMQQRPATAGAGQTPIVVGHEQRPLEDLVEESF